MSSFIAEGTNVICTNMTNGSPLKIGLHHTSNVMYRSKSEPLLNKLDKKISASFSCKNTSKFWGGFAMLALGIAVGALLVVAIVATGGAAGILLAATVAATTTLATGVVIAAGAAAIAFAVTSIYKTAHDCDLTLSSDWVEGTLHDKVRINGNSALLNISIISCKNGGVVSIVLDPEVAAEAAKEISKNNNQEISEHYKSEFFIGVVNGVAFTAFPSLVGVLLGGGLVSYDYVHTQNNRRTDEAEHVEKSKSQEAWDATKDNGKLVGTATSGDVAKDYYDVHGEKISSSKELGEQASKTRTEAGGMQNQADEFGKTATQRELGGASESSVESAKLGQKMSKEAAEDLSEKAGGFAAKSEAALASSRNVGSVFKSINWANIVRGFTIGVAAAVSSYFIDDHYYEKEKDLQKDAVAASKDARKEDNIGLKESNKKGAILSITK
ncbi:uncharacterized membrane protein (DUF485 family) [Pedobacter sp. UYP30]|uniref:hypothetical protein n=1 Tax=Pedobacter sp. UYP30 TaxID=1756400 RepID=UPI00339858BB